RSTGGKARPSGKRIAARGRSTELPAARQVCARQGLARLRAPRPGAPRASWREPPIAVPAAKQPQVSLVPARPVAGRHLSGGHHRVENVGASAQLLVDVDAGVQAQALLPGLPVVTTPVRATLAGGARDQS